MNFEELQKLSVDEKMNLIELIWDSIESDSIKVTQAQKEELDKRLERHKSGEGRYYSLDEVRNMLANKRNK